MDIVFLGSADFGIPATEHLISRGHCLRAVVTRSPRPGGRGRKRRPTAVGEWTRRRNISPVFTPDDLREPDFVREISSIGADLFFVAAFRILPPRIFSIPRLGTVNLHASLLPRYRGAAPIQRAIQNGEVRTGVTVFRINEGIDTGGILVRRQTGIGERETTPQLYRRLSLLGAEAVADAVGMLEQEKPPVEEQDETCATRAPRLRKEEGLVRWEEEATTIFNKIRAFTPFPLVFTYFKGKRIVLDWALPRGDAPGPEGEPGSVVQMGRDYFDVACGGGILRILSVKPEGRRVMSAGDFCNGFRLRRGMRLGTVSNREVGPEP